MSGSITAVLGPTNTGKTFLAIERLMAHPSGIIGLPLRLLAREVYDKVAAVKGPRAVALATGEERLGPADARYVIATVEAMPADRRFDFLAVDEIQLCTDPERGHVFTDRLLHARGGAETMLLGSDTMRLIVRALVPEARIERRERFSALSYAGPRKLTRLPRRTAIVAFSAQEVYAIAELIRRHRGGAAVVMGALSPRTRNAQVAMYQNGDVDFLVATDAIGMGLNMDVDHVAFASRAKFDGRRNRRLRADELAQIAGRAGRFRSDGGFGETADCPALGPELAVAIENHSFDPVETIEWRNSRLSFDNADSLLASLAGAPPDVMLRRCQRALDEETFQRLLDDDAIAAAAASPSALRRLWSLCQLPDFRKSTVDEHVRLTAAFAQHLVVGAGHLPEDMIAREMAKLDREEGDLDALQARLAHVRTWTYAANRADWLADPAHWRERTRLLEDKLSDLLHAGLAARFVDRRTSALLKGLKREDALLAGVDHMGEVTVEGHYVGRLVGLVFEADARAVGLEEKALRNVAVQALRPEVTRRLAAVAQADDDAFTLQDDGKIRFQGEIVAALAANGSVLKPAARLIGGELGADQARARALQRVSAWLAQLAARELGALKALEDALSQGLVSGLARGLADRLAEAAGALPRARAQADIDALSAAERRALRALGVRFGRQAVFLPALLKPRPARLLALFAHAAAGGQGPLFLPPPGAASTPRDPSAPGRIYAVAGYYPAGPRAIRFDVLDRFADHLWSLGAGRQGVREDPALAAMIGAPGGELGAILKALGYHRMRRAGPEAPALWRAPRPAPLRRTGAPAIGLHEDSPFAALSQLRPAPAPAPAVSRRRRQRKAAP